MADCKRCGKPIKWSKSEDGNFIPMEKDKPPKECLMVVDYELNDKGWKTPIVRPVKLYETHRSNCEEVEDQGFGSEGFSLSGMKREEPKKTDFVEDDLPF